MASKKRKPPPRKGGFRQLPGKGKGKKPKRPPKKGGRKVTICRQTNPPKCTTRVVKGGRGR